jgi:signal peptidase
VLGLALVCVGLPAASASTLGTLDAADLVASRSTARPVQPVPGTGQVAVAVTRSDHTSYCADVTVSTVSSTPIRWQAAVTPATISSNPVYRLDAVPSAVTGARTVSFTNGTWTVAGDGSNDVIRAGSPVTWSYCAPWSTAAALVDATATVRVTEETGAGANARYCAEVTVTTTSTDWQRWRTTISSSTNGVSGPKYRLSSAPVPSGAVTTGFTGGNQWRWTVRGDATQPVVKAGAPAVWTYCT